MVLKTKSIQAESSLEDGLRICVMRKVYKKYHWDMWWRNLAPSLELWKDYREGRATWEDYVPRFNQEVLVEQAEYVKELAELAKRKDVTILCYETTPEKCHRRLLAEACKEYVPDLEIILE